MASETSLDDPFVDALNIESTFYDRGYQEGLSDGKTAGIVEGRALGLRTGFDKFFESGRLAGRVVIWANRLPSAVQGSKLISSETGCTTSLTPLPSNARLEKNVSVLHELLDPGTLSTENSDASVQDFDDRLKRAQGKAKVIQRAIGGNGGPPRH